MLEYVFCNLLIITECVGCCAVETVRRIDGDCAHNVEAPIIKFRCLK